ncbi:hypothetical protein EON62_00370, partial [archaeon]
LFSLERPPGKTLLIGGGYVALECAGFLSHIGQSASVMVRDELLRGFDAQMAGKVVEYMAATGTKFMRGYRPLKLERVGEGDAAKVRVHFKSTADAGDESIQSEEFDTVVFATGRAPVTTGLNLEGVGVAMHAASGKVLGNRGVLVAPGSASAAAAAAATAAAQSHAGKVSHKAMAGGAAPGASVAAHLRGSMWSETTSVPSVHVVGDALYGTAELTPVAIRAGKLLAQRIMAGLMDGKPEDEEDAAQQALYRGAVMDYHLVPTTVFTPMEYGCVGLSEEAATAMLGADAVDVYHLQYDTLELSLAHRVDVEGTPMPPQCYMKLIVAREEGGRVLGLHVMGPSAGEVIQGFAVGMRMGMTKADVEATVGIHPTHAEEVVGLDRTKRSGEPFVKSSC